MDLLFLVVGIAMLAAGGEFLIRGALSAARRLGVSPLLSGLVIVGFGTSAPELVVSLKAALGSQPDIAVGNVVGSNIANVLLILGLCGVIRPLTVQPMALRRDAVTVILASVLFVALAWSGTLERWGGAILFGGMVGYLILAYRTERRPESVVGELREAESQEVAPIPGSLVVIVLGVVGGLALLVLGSDVLLRGAVGLAQSLGLSEAVIGLTLVAVGTSLPEFAISVMATWRGHADVAVGNVLGSNLFNVLGILGVSAMVQPLPIHPQIAGFDQWAMLATALVAWVFLATGRRLSRAEGAIFLVAYAAYVYFTVARV